MRKIIYYTSVADALAYGTQLMRNGYACYMDQPVDDTVFSAIAGVDSDIVELAREFLFQRMEVGTDFEKAIVQAVFWAHYPRVFRCHASLEAHEKAAYFIPQEKATCYDLALANEQHTEFLSLQNAESHPYDLQSLVEFYRPSGYATRLRKRWSLRLRGKGHRGGNHDTSAGKQRHNILFLAHDNEVNLYLKPVVPIIKELSGRQIPFSVISCDSRAQAFLEKEDVPHIKTEDLPPGAGATVAHEANDMARWFQDCIDTEIHPSGNLLYDALMRYALNSATRRDLWEGRKSAERITEHAAREKITDVFFVPDGTPIASELGRTFATAGIRTHTILAAGVSQFKRGVDYYSSETIYCSGSLAASAIEYHFPHRRIVTVGSPALQRYTKIKAIAASDPRVTVLVATSGFDASETTWMAELIAAIDASRFRLVFKPHPSHADRYEHLKNMVLNGHQVVAYTEPIENLVNSAGAIITDHSQVGIDAHLLGKPVISMANADTGILYMKDIASVKYVHSTSALVQALEEVLSNTFIDPDFIAMYNAGGDSHYYRRVVDSIMNSQY